MNSCAFSVFFSLIAFAPLFTKSHFLGLIIEECFSERDQLGGKLNRLQARANVTVLAIPCGDFRAAHDRVCSLVNDGAAYMIALASSPVLNYFQVAFDTLSTPINPNREEINDVVNIIGRIVGDITRAWRWRNLYIYADQIFGDMVPRCYKRLHRKRPCQFSLVWSKENTVEEFLTQTVSKCNSPTLQKSKSYFVIVVSDQQTKEIIRKANELGMFSNEYEWIIFHPGTYNVLESLRVLTYESNVFLTRMQSKTTILRDILEIREDFKNECATTWQNVQSERIEQICGSKTKPTQASTVGDDTEKIENHVFEILEVIATTVNKKPSLRQLAEWSHKHGYKTIRRRAMSNFEGITLKVATLDTPPYVIAKNINSTHTEFSGYLIELLEIVAEKLNFTYEIINVPDQEYGDQKNETYWSGIIGAVQRGEADLALANLTPLAKRSEAVRFLRPAVAVGGFELYYRKPTSQEDSAKFGTYFRPFHYLTWVASLLLLLLMTFFLGVVCEIQLKSSYKYLINRAMQDDFRLRNFIFTATQIASQQGLTYIPHGTPSRIVFVVMWFFSCLLFVSYSANLTSYFTASEVALPIRNLADFLSQSEYQISFKSGTSYLMTIRNDTTSNEYMGLKDILSKNPSLIVTKIEDGFKRAAKEKLIFAHDRGTVRWRASKSCDFVVAGPTYMKVGVTLATNHHSPFYKGFNKAIKMLQENGILKRYQKKWLSQGSQCKTKNSNFQPVTIEIMTGPFLCLTGGLASALLVIFIEKSPILKSTNCITGNAAPRFKFSKQNSVIMKNNISGLRSSYGFKRNSTVRRRIVNVRRSTTFLTY